MGLFDRLVKRPKGVEPRIGQRVWVGLEFLEGMVKQGTVDQEGLNRARDYLEAGGWTAKSSGV